MQSTEIDNLLESRFCEMSVRLNKVIAWTRHNDRDWAYLKVFVADPSEPVLEINSTFPLWSCVSESGTRGAIDAAMAVLERKIANKTDRLIPDFEHLERCYAKDSL
jgi:hypothetical protein